MFHQEKSREYQSNRKIIYGLTGAVIFALIFIIAILAGVFFYMTKVMKESNSENVPDFGTEQGTESVIESVPNFGTSVKITNLDEYATPLLEEKASLLEVKLSEYAEVNHMELKESSIIHVMIPEENIHQLYFFCRLSAKDEIVLLIFDRETGAVTATKCEYSEEEILNEVWEGICPSDRDIQE